MAFASALLLSSIVMLGLGGILTIIGLGFLIANQYKSKPWYIWFLIALGGVMVMIGLVLLAFALHKNGKVVQEQRAALPPSTGGSISTTKTMKL